MTEPRVSETDAVALLRSAAHDLHPVVIEMGPEQARFSSFIGAVEDEGAGYAVLEPVAEALPEVTDQPFRIVSSAGPGWFVVAHRIERTGPHRARVELSRARAFDADPPPGSVAVLATELLALVIPGGLQGSSAHVFPVLRIGADVCEIRSCVALEPGRDLDCVEIIGDRRLLRRASAQVLETVPWFLPDGSRTFSCRLSLSVMSGHVPRDHDLVSDPAEVSRLLGLAGTMQCEGWYEAPGGGRGLLRFAQVGEDHVRFALSAPPARSGLRTQVHMRIGVELLALSYELDVRMLEHRDDHLLTTLPLILRRRRGHRREQRVQVSPPHQVELSFRNPVTGAVHKHPVAELSYFHVSFDCQVAGAVLWEGLPLQQAQLTWRDRLVHLGDLAVQRYGYDASSKRVRCTGSITHCRIVDDPDMICLLATLAHPRVRTQAHVPSRPAPRADAADIVRTFVAGSEHAPDAAVTMIRAWENCWILQHFADGSPEITGATGRLQHAYLDHLVPRPDGRYLVFVVESDDSAMNAYLYRFFASTGAPEAMTRCAVELWSRAAHARTGRQPAGAVQVRTCAHSDELVVARAAERWLGPYGAGALSMVPGEISLPDTVRRFTNAGLQRRRSCRLVSRGDELIYAILEERTTPAANPILNASWVLPMHPDREDGGGLDAALATISQQAPDNECFINLPEGLDPQRLADWGFAKAATFFLYIITRAALHRFSSHGELDFGADPLDRRSVDPRNGGSPAASY